MHESDASSGETDQAESKTKSRQGTFDLSKTVHPMMSHYQPFVADIRTSMTEPPYLLIDKYDSDQQKLSLFNADDYVKRLHAMAYPNRSILTMADEDIDEGYR